MPRLGQRLHSWLHVADHPSWHHQLHYSSQLAQALAYAHVQLHYAREQADPYFRAYAALAPFRNQQVCQEQRLNLEFTLALAFAGDDSPPQAIACLASAWEIAERLHDWAAQAEVGYLAGALWRASSHFTDAYAVFQDALEALRRLTRDDGPADPAFELDLILRLAGCTWELGLFPVCLHYVDEAYTLRAVWVPSAAEEAAHLAWLDAQLARVQGQPFRALKQAGAAADLLLTHGPPINKGRAHTLLADSALDLLQLTHAPAISRNPERLPVEPSTTRQLSLEDLLTQARTAARIALDVAQGIQDPIGATLARLALRRATRLSRPGSGDASGVGAAEKLLRTARRLDDPALLGRAEVALADELLVAGRPEAARFTYWRAIRRFEEHHFGGLAFWPRHALRQCADDEE